MLAKIRNTQLSRNGVRTFSKSDAGFVKVSHMSRHRDSPEKIAAALQETFGIEYSRLCGAISNNHYHLKHRIGSHYRDSGHNRLFDMAPYALSDQGGRVLNLLSLATSYYAYTVCASMPWTMWACGVFGLNAAGVIQLRFIAAVKKKSAVSLTVMPDGGTVRVVMTNGRLFECPIKTIEMLGIRKGFIQVNMQAMNGLSSLVYFDYRNLTEKEELDVEGLLAISHPEVHTVSFGEPKL